MKILSIWRFFTGVTLSPDEKKLLRIMAASKLSLTEVVSLGAKNQMSMYQTLGALENLKHKKFIIMSFFDDEILYEVSREKL